MENNEKVLYLNFQVPCDTTQFGENVHVTGNNPCLGNWNPENSVKLYTNKDTFPIWKSNVQEIRYSTNTNKIEYKYIIKKNNHIQWENFSGNRYLNINNIENLIKDQPESPVDILDKKFGVNTTQRISLPKINSNGEIMEEYKLEHITNNSTAKFINLKEFKNSITYDLDNLIKLFVNTNAEKRSWKEKLSFIAELLKTSTNFENEFLAVISIYLFFINTGQIKCIEDGTHFRPNHHSNLAFSIFTTLLSNMTENNSIIVRSVLQNLPSFSDQYMVSVPMTRIRDIAHRNDIPRDLKDEIKYRLQNKLHRSASPDDLQTCEYFLRKITENNADYSKDFVKEFKLFAEELKEFFNSLGLEKSLLKLQEISPDDSLKKEISKMLNLKNQSMDKLLQKFEQVIKLRRILNKTINDELKKEEKCNKSFLQLSSISEIELEKLSYMIISEYVEENYYRKQNITLDQYQFILNICILCLDSMILSNIKREECIFIRDDLSYFTANFNFNSLTNFDKDRLSILKLKSVLDRCLNSFYDITEDVNKFFTLPAYTLGKALKINQHSVDVFCESFIRGHIIFQFSKIITLILNKIRELLKLPPFTTISTGEAKGHLLYLEKLADFNPEENHLQQYIVFLKESDGSEEIPNQLKGIVLSHDVPQLSHLAIRCRQNKVAFVCCLDYNIFIDQFVKQFQPSSVLQMKVKSDDDIKVEKLEGMDTQISEMSNNLNDGQYNETELNQDYIMEEINDNENDYIIHIENAEKRNTGSKCSNMKDLFRFKDEKYETPKSLCIPFHVYQKYVLEILTQEDFNLIDKCSFEALEKNCTIMREKFLEKYASIGDEETNQLNLICKKINQFFPSNKLLAIRSSSNLEDLKTNAGAGLFDSYLGIENSFENNREIKDTICKVWASLFTYRGLIARRNNNISSNKSRMSVLVQEMINPEFSFVIHTINPINQLKNEVYIELVIGLGETLASARQRGSPYRIIYNKSNDSVQINNFASFTYAIKNGNELERISYKEKTLSTNDDYIIEIGRRLGKISVQIEQNFDNIPQDIEGAVNNNKIYLMQTRPQMV